MKAFLRRTLGLKPKLTYHMVAAKPVPNVGYFVSFPSNEDPNRYAPIVTEYMGPDAMPRRMTIPIPSTWQPVEVR